MVLSTLTVTSPLDDGSSGTLRSVIGSAMPGDTINFARRLNGDTIALTQGPLSVTISLDIAGPGASDLTISGHNSSRVLDVAGGASLTLTGLTIADGRYDTVLGGSILTYGGGGILNEPGASLTLVNDTLTNNSAVGHQTVGVNGQDELGGALFNLGKATITHCEFTNNQVLGGGDTNSAIGGSAGGAIDNYNGATLAVTDTLFRKDLVVSADGFTGVVYFALGGAIENNAGTGEHGDTTPSTANLTDCWFIDCSAEQVGPNGLSNGGAICTEGTGTSMTLTDCLITGNLSMAGAGGSDNQGDGGGVQNNGGTLIISGCTISNNKVVGGPGGDLTLDNRSGAAFGGGVISSGGTVTITNSTISGNIAQGSPTATGPGGDAAGGGISGSGGATVTVLDCLVSNNLAIAGMGGAGGTLGTTAAAGFAIGGGVLATSSSTVNLVGCTIVGNVAQGSAGLNGNTGGDGVGGGVAGSLTALRGHSDHSQITVTGCAIAGNVAVGGAGSVGANGGNGLGGGMAIASGCTASVVASFIEFNDALGGDAGPGGTDGQGVGGGVYVFAGGDFTYDATTVIKRNRASTSHNNIGP
jgi:hypothetical protein